jgi:hypothetical protein
MTADVHAKPNALDTCYFSNPHAQMVQFLLDDIVGLARPRNFCSSGWLVVNGSN